MRRVAEKNFLRRRATGKSKLAAKTGNIPRHANETTARSIPAQTMYVRRGLTTPRKPLWAHFNKGNQGSDAQKERIQRTPAGTHTFSRPGVDLLRRNNECQACFLAIHQGDTVSR